VGKGTSDPTTIFDISGGYKMERSCLAGEAGITLIGKR
jgi:hypothetical protein